MSGEPCGRLALRITLPGTREIAMRSGFLYLREFVRAPRTIGAVWPSSDALACTMVDWIDWPQVATVLEYGPGDGALTEAILQAKRHDARYLGIECSQGMAERLVGRFPGIEVAVDRVEDVERICSERNIAQADAVVCGLPWAAWDRTVQARIVEATLRVLAPEGQFTTFAYLQGLIAPGGLSFARVLREGFAAVERSRIVWRNVPPAIAYRARSGHGAEREPEP